MADEAIKNQELKKRLNNIRLKDWMKFAEGRGLVVTSGTRGFHYTTVRDPNVPGTKDIRGVITTITPNCFRESNQKTFKRFIESAYPKTTFGEGWA